MTPARVITHGRVDLTVFQSYSNEEVTWTSAVGDGGGLDALRYVREEAQYRGQRSLLSELNVGTILELAELVKLGKEARRHARTEA